MALMIFTACGEKIGSGAGQGGRLGPAGGTQRPVSQYLKGWETFSDYTMYECLPGSNVWTETTNTNLSQVASSKKWDVVTIQEPLLR